MKKLLMMLLVLALAAGLCACGGNGGGNDSGAAAQIDLTAAADALLDSGAFSDVLSRPADSVAARLYGFDDADVTECVLFTGTGATAEEILLVQAADSAAASKIQQQCQTRVENQKTAFENYVPEELVKLDGAILQTSGNYVFFVVAADAAAARTALASYTG